MLPDLILGNFVLSTIRNMADSNTADSGRRLLRGLLENEQVLCALSGVIQGTSQPASGSGDATTSSLPRNDGRNEHANRQNLTVQDEMSRIFGRTPRSNAPQFNMPYNFTGNKKGKG